MEKVTAVLFRKVTFDDDSLSNLQRYGEGGRNVYASFQSSSTSLLIFTNLLRRNGFAVPYQAIGFQPYIFQIVSTFLRRAFRLILELTGRSKGDTVEDGEYLREVIEDDKGIIVSLLSRRQFIRRYIEIKSDTLQSLVEMQKTMDEPILVFPQLMFWNRNPERTRTFVTSRATGDRGLLTGIFTIMKSATPAFIRIPAPINLKDEISAAESAEPYLIAHQVRKKILDIYNHEKRVILGPVIKSQGETMEKVLYHKNVLDEINRQISEDRVSEKKLRKKAYNYFREIAADFSIIYIKFFDRALDYIFSKIFKGIHYDPDDFRKLREASQKGPLILVPSHKSHMDYLIVSSLFYQNKLIPPHILAGANLTFFPMGKIFRRSGAFFMRRSFKGLDLYSVVFRQYIKTLVSEGYSIEFFIEGGRTRTGKLMAPRMGMLKYLNEAVEEGYNRDISFVPVTINYDRILEENSYHNELKGKEKKEESTSGFVKSRKLLKRQYGSVYVNFGEPLSYQEMKKETDEEEDLITETADRLIEGVNELVMITPFAITTAAILFSSARGFSKKVLLRNMLQLHRYLAGINAPMAESVQKEEDLEKVASTVIDAYLKDGILQEMSMEGIEISNSRSLEDLYVINEEDRIKISFYRNTIIHFLLPLGFGAAALLKQEKGHAFSVDKVAQTYLEVGLLFQHDFVPTAVMRSEDAGFSSVLAFLEKEGFVSRADGEVSLRDENRDGIRFFAGILKDYLESYLTIFDTAVHLSKERIDKKEFLAEARKNGIKLFHLGTIRLMESLSNANYASSLVLLKAAGILSEEASGKKTSVLVVEDQEKAVKYLNTVREYLNSMDV